MANALLDSLPAWAKELSEKYYSRTITMFVLHGNVRDLVAFRRDDATEFCGVHRFLRSGLFGQRDLVITYDRGGGLSFAEPRMQEDFRQAISGYDQFHGTSYSTALPRNPDGVLNLLDNYLRLRIADGRKIALIVDFAETIAPSGDVSYLAADDRSPLVSLNSRARQTECKSADQPDHYHPHDRQQESLGQQRVNRLDALVVAADQQPITVRQVGGIDADP